MFNDNDILNYLNISLTNHNSPISRSVKFWIYLIFLTPSIICTLFVLYYLLSNRTLRCAIHNHAIIIFLFIGLIYQITTYPWMLYYYYKNDVWQRTSSFCTIWIFIDWGLYFTQTILFAWATIERHILIFHKSWTSTKKKRLIVHYLPLCIIIFYCLIYYIVVIFFPPCKNHSDSYNMICIQLCFFFQSPALYTYDIIVHQMLPNLLIVIFSIALLLRVCRQKYRVGQSLQWRKHWKMTIQLLFVAFIYLIFSFPITLMNFLHLFSVSRQSTSNLFEYLLVLNYCMILLCPFACASALPQSKNKIKNILQIRQQARVVAPMTRHIRNTILNQTFA